MRTSSPIIVVTGIGGREGDVQHLVERAVAEGPQVEREDVLLARLEQLAFVLQAAPIHDCVSNR